MAKLFSEEQLNRARKKYFGKIYFTDNKLKTYQVLINKFLIYFFNFKILLVNLKRNIIKLFLKNSLKNKSGENNILLNIDDNKIKKISKELKEKNYIFVTNFIENGCYLKILNNWPNINFFKQNNKIIKYLSVGFKCREGTFSETDEKILKSHMELKNLYEFLSSSHFKKIINSILNFENKDFYNYEIKSTMVGNNSFLIPHVDGMTETMNCAYNFIYFLDGNDEDLVYSGATTIFEDNSFAKPIIKPKTMKNSILIYKSTEKLFHGFDFTKLPKNFYRKTVNFEFYPK